MIIKVHAEWLPQMLGAKLYVDGTPMRPGDFIIISTRGGHWVWPRQPGLTR